ncbi:nicotinate-nucleotide adenylyltransferase [Caminicella sporogenes DSM 14501]|uniref:Probable nicotinate-nucleotide adenylyltransferase n=1 Tax=Caminicella sporogenes DSM 14501 TaxID=1121266 RepID=A0A1M6LV42_9FIRM|nr:nicotinate-nucleotide adenylyltransferase [Caminicella sporogenes]RKD27961.1 nicotinate (nicotinamide) nucleotide adenylyltransferase [Caminicella sporogenes]WIF94436.1 nicotinate-nucleotide adenylyltransferase [Caminicella sporogenes]SHJ75025.1 nicotinate-nucleotide adenylyltransferase [Caminicella sporogenes DSM 14501]
MKRIGLMGGTFDPIHYGHLVLAEQVRTQFQLEKIIFIPSGIPPHKDSLTLSSAKDRYIMTLLATVTNPYFEVSEIEIKDKEISYTIKTIKKLKNIFGSDTELFFITGADALYEIDTWKSPEELLKLCSFIGATRPGFDEEKLKKKIDFYKREYSANIFITSVPALAISSTDIRDRIKEGRSVKYLLPEAVEHYIYKNKLYL